MGRGGLRGRRSDCPINFAAEVLGDRWSLVILRDIVFWGKRTYGELMGSDESIATNVLASRLRHLETEGLIRRSADPDDRRKDRHGNSESMHRGCHRMDDEGDRDDGDRGSGHRHWHPVSPGKEPAFWLGPDFEFLEVEAVMLACGPLSLITSPAGLEGAGTLP